VLNELEKSLKLLKTKYSDQSTKMEKMEQEIAKLRNELQLNSDKFTEYSSTLNIPSYALSDHFPVAITRKCKHNKATKPYHYYIIYRSANRFNTHFCNIHQTVAVDKSITYTPSDSHINTLKTNLLNIEKFNKPMVTVKFVERQLKTLDTAISTGVDNINAKYLKLSAIIKAPILTYAFNCSIDSNKFPNVFKVAKVIPIYKKGDKYDNK